MSNMGGKIILESGKADILVARAGIAEAPARYAVRRVRRIGLWTLLLLGACGSFAPALAEPLACDDGIKTAFHPDVDTTVVAVR